MSAGWKSRVLMVYLGLLAAAFLAPSFTGCLPAPREPLPTGSGGYGSTPVSGSAGTGFVEPQGSAGSGGTAPGRGGAAGTIVSGRGGTGGSVSMSCSGGSSADGGVPAMSQGRGLLYPPN